MSSPDLAKALDLHKQMITNLRHMRSTIHQLITHPQADLLNDGAMLENLAKYRHTVCSAIEVTRTLLDKVRAKPGGFYRSYSFETLLQQLKDGTF